MLGRPQRRIEPSYVDPLPEGQLRLPLCERYQRVEASVLVCPEYTSCSRGAQVVYDRLGLFINAVTREWRVSVPLLAQYAGYSEAHTTRCLTELVDAGLIARRRTFYWTSCGKVRQSANLYTLLTPPSLLDQMSRLTREPTDAVPSWLNDPGPSEPPLGWSEDEGEACAWKADLPGQVHEDAALAEPFAGEEPNEAPLSSSSSRPNDTATPPLQPCGGITTPSDYPSDPFFKPPRTSLPPSIPSERSSVGQCQDETTLAFEQEGPADPLTQRDIQVLMSILPRIRELLPLRRTENDARTLKKAGRRLGRGRVFWNLRFWATDPGAADSRRNARTGRWSPGPSLRYPFSDHARTLVEGLETTCSLQDLVDAVTPPPEPVSPPPEAPALLRALKDQGHLTDVEADPTAEADLVRVVSNGSSELQSSLVSATYGWPVDAVGKVFARWLAHRSRSRAEVLGVLDGIRRGDSDALAHALGESSGAPETSGSSPPCSAPDPTEVLAEATDIAARIDVLRRLQAFAEALPDRFRDIQRLGDPTHRHLATEWRKAPVWQECRWLLDQLDKPEVPLALLHRADRYVTALTGTAQDR